MARVKQQKLHPAFRPCRDYIIAMFVLVAMSTYLYGLRVPMLVATSVITAILCDLLVFGIRRRQYKFSDLSSIMFAMTFTVMMPASSSYAIIAIGTLVTVLLGKQAFGGYGCYPFNPAAFGFAFVSVCWPSEVYMYPKSFSGIGLGLTCNTALFEAPAHSLKLGGVPEIDKVDFLLGNYPGPLGTTFCIVILSCLFLLIAHKTITYHIPLTFLATCAVWAFLFPRISTGRIDSVVLEMLSGAVIFASVFMAPEPSTSPVNPRAKVVYGVLLGAGTMIFRTFGVFEMGICFAVLLLNPLSSYLDRKFAPHSVAIKRGQEQ